MVAAVHLLVKNAGCKIDQDRLPVDKWKSGLAIFATSVGTRRMKAQKPQRRRTARTTKAALPPLRSRGRTIGNRRLQLATSQQLAPLEEPYTVIPILLRTLRQCNNAWVHYEIVASRDEEIFFHIGVDRPLWQRSPRIVQLYREVLVQHLLKLLRGAKSANSQGDWCRCV